MGQGSREEKEKEEKEEKEGEGEEEGTKNDKHCDIMDLPVPGTKPDEKV